MHQQITPQVAAIQMVSTASVQENLQQADKLISQAVAAGAALVLLPEYFCILGNKDTDKLAVREPLGEGPIQQFLSQQAARHGIWLVGGTLPLDSGDPAHSYNAMLAYNPQGKLVGHYNKIHLFGFCSGAESYNESATLRPGEPTPQVLETPLGRVGMSVCYDLRFPELYRAMGKVSLLLVPSAFTYTTGSAHWEILLRARAIENQCYVLAAAQGGQHPNGRRTWGHSMLIDPWGRVLRDLPEGPGVVIGPMCAETITTVRQSLPALDHRRMVG